MRWYINDVSLQGQFNDVPHFLSFLDELLRYRNASAGLRAGMYLTRLIADRPVAQSLTLRQVLQSTDRTDLRRAVLLWLDRRGPFVEDDRRPETDDYFECKGLDVTDTGLGEAARRVKSDLPTQVFSFSGGTVEFGEATLTVDHGLPDDRLGAYLVDNLWKLSDLASSALNTLPVPSNWMQLVETAREQFPNLLIPDNIYTNPALSREPFDLPIADRAFALFKHLNEYMLGRNDTGADGPGARAVIETFFTGDRALFSGESSTNQEAFKSQMTFSDPNDPSSNIFAHWHGKISHRYFRMHFEWPVPPQQKKLKILYLGPKITKK